MNHENELADLLQKYGAETIDPRSMSSLQQWAMKHYTEQEEQGASPFVALTLPLDISDSYLNYKKNYAHIAGASYTTFFVWHLQKTLQSVPEINIRYIQNQWYQLKEAPLFMPIYVGGDKRFCTALLEGFAEKHWPEAAAYYRKTINEAKNGTLERLSVYQFQISNSFSNLSTLPFTSYSTSTVGSDSLKSTFVIGKRYTERDRLKLPFYLNTHHGTSDGHIINKLIGNLCISLLN